MIIDSAIGVEQAVFASVAAWRVLALFADFVAVVITGEAFVDIDTGKVAFAVVTSVTAAAATVVVRAFINIVTLESTFGVRTGITAVATTIINGTFIDVRDLASVGHTAPLVTIVDQAGAVRGHQTRHATAKAGVATAPTAGNVVINAAHGDVEIVLRPIEAAIAIPITIPIARAIAGAVI